MIRAVEILVDMALYIITIYEISYKIITFGFRFDKCSLYLIGTIIGNI